MENKILPIQNSYWVVPGHFRAGEHPAIGSTDGTRLKLRWLFTQNINFILDLTEPGEADANYESILQKESFVLNQPVVYKRFSIPDWSIPPHEKMIEILDTIETTLSSGKNIYVHCYGGLGRTGLIVGCYLSNHGLMGIQALARISELRFMIPGEHKISPETEKQRKMVLEWTRKA